MNAGTKYTPQDVILSNQISYLEIELFEDEGKLIIQKMGKLPILFEGANLMECENKAKMFIYTQMMK